MTFNFHAFRSHFPYFQQEMPAVYLDNAATTLKPQTLIDATVEFYRSAGSVHRSQYDEEQTAKYEQARQRVQRLIGAESRNAVIWTSGTTQGINLVARGLGLTAQDEILISEADHHANFVTWHEIAKQYGATIRVLPILDNWLIDKQALINELNSHTKLVALNFVSNVTGTEQPIAELISLIRQHSNALILLDAAQAISHRTIDLAQLDADFIVFSAHKIYGPTGLGVLSGKLTALSHLQPSVFGGKMVKKVSRQGIDFSELPYRLEAGTPNIAAVVAFDSVLAWLEQWQLEQTECYAVNLAEQVKQRLATYPRCRLFNSPQPSTIVCFTFNQVSSSDLSTLLTEQGIALRSGEHCAQPYLARLGQPSTLRLSFAPYNNAQEIEQFFTALDKSLALLDAEL